MKLGNKFILTAFIAVAAVISPCSAWAQTGVNSPYSRYGLGLIADQSVGMARSMGGVGVGMRRTNTINPLNPASYSAVDTLTFIADMGFTMQNGNFQESGVKVNARNARVDYLTMQYRILPKVGMTVGLLPYSSVGYAFSNTSTVRRDEDGEIQSTGTYTGTGGIRQFLGGLGYRPAKWLSVGVNASYMFGELGYSSVTSFSESTVSTATVNNEASLSALKLDFGIQTSLKLDGAVLAIGATYTPATDFSGEVTVSDLTTDTEAEPQSLSDGAFSMPDMMAVGMSYSAKKLTLAADVSYEKWSDANAWGQKYGSDRLKLNTGFSYCPDNTSKSFLQRNTYHGGLYMKQPYFNVGDGKGPMEYGISAGFTLPVTIAYNSMSYLHFSAQYVRVQPASSGMIAENYLRLSVGVTFMERWFAKWMVE